MNVEKEIQKENAIRRIRNIEVKRLEKILEPFVGSKILKADGELVKKLKDLLEFNRGQKIEPLAVGGYAKVQVIYVRSTTYSLILHLSICYSGGSYDVNPSTAYCEYKNNDYYLGDIKDRILAKLYSTEKMPMLNAEKQRKQFDKVAVLRNKLEAERDKLFYGLRDKN